MEGHAALAGAALRFELLSPS
ncbi:hypothetical protein EVA_05254, partial [gut metagenome]